jgi:hypothetical protein
VLVHIMFVSSLSKPVRFGLFTVPKKAPHPGNFEAVNQSTKNFMHLSVSSSSENVAKSKLVSFGSADTFQHMRGIQL